MTLISRNNVFDIDRFFNDSWPQMVEPQAGTFFAPRVDIRESGDHYEITAELPGVAKNRSNYSLQIVDAKGRLHLLQMADVKKLPISETTSMPTDFAKRLTRDELRDLLAYLAAQDIRLETAKGSK